MTFTIPALVVALVLGPMEQPIPHGAEPDRAPFRTAITLTVGGGDAMGSDDAVRAGTLGIRWLVRESLSVAAQMRWLHFQRSRRSTHGGGAALLGRWHPVRGSRGTLFLEGGVGGVLTREAVPLGGTPANFSTHLGVGSDLALVGRVRLTGGIRWDHISNANISRPNPGWDALYAYLGLGMRVSEER